MGADASKELKQFESVDLTRLGEILPWTLSKAFRLSEHLTDDDEVELSVFDYSDNPENFENALKIVKSIRHPGVISLKEFSTTSRNGSLGRLVTEPVSPLLNVIQGLDFQEICSGLYDITRTIAFLHDSVCLVHNSIKLSSVFVAKDGSWKLGSFENAFILRTGGGFETDRKGFVSLVESLVDVIENFCNEDKDTNTSILSQFHQDIAADTETLDFKYILHHSLFQLELVQIRKFLTEIVLKSVDEKTEFFRDLPTKLARLSETLIAKRLTKPLLQRFVLLDRTASMCFLPSFLTPRKLKDQKGSRLEDITPILGDELFKLHVTPILLRIFCIREARIRRVLLENFNQYFRSFDRNQLIDPILSELLLSARDTDDHLVELSLHALADLVSVLGGDVIMGTKRAQCFYDGHVKELKAPLDQESESADEPRNSSVKQQSVDGLNDILRVERREIERNDRGKERERTRSFMATGHPNKISALSETCSSLTTTSPKQLTFTDSIHNADSSNALFKCKSLESLTKNHSSISKPVAVIEPKTIYQLSIDTGAEQKERRDEKNNRNFNFNNSDDNRNDNTVINNHVNNKDGFFDKDVTTENYSLTLNDRITNKSEKMQLQKNRSSKPPTLQNPQDSINSEGQNGPTSEQTLLVLSKQVQGVEQTALSVNASNLIIQENDSNNSFSDWEENWEDMDEPSIETPSRQKKDTSLREKISFIEIAKSPTKPINNDGTRFSATKSMNDHVPTEAPPKSNLSNRRIDQPLGFGYDIKLIEVKSRSKVEDEEDLEWKLFADLAPVIKPQKDDVASLFFTENMNEPETILHNKGKSEKDKNSSNRLIETTRLGMSQYEPELNSSSGTSLGWEAEESDLNLD